MNPSIQILTTEDALLRLQKRNFDHAASYLAMYSTWLGGIIKDKSLMIVPVDDHVVHRGDGIFEAIKFSGKKIYTLDRHLARLWKSSEFVSMKMPCTQAEMKEIIVETVRASGADGGLIRLYVTRGPGGFTTNPYESVGSQLYIVITTLKPPPKEKYENGLKIQTSRIKVKEDFFANVKSCNYLPNVLMKKEAVDSGVDFTVTVDENNYLAEGSTENFLMLSRAGELCVPNFDRILRGITVTRLMELASALERENLITGVSNQNITKDDVLTAREVYMAGTTMDIMPVVEFDGKPIGNGKPGPVFPRLLKLLQDDQMTGETVLTSV